MQQDLDIRNRAWGTLRQHVHELLAGAYRRLIPSNFAQSHEPQITGELCRAMVDFLADIDAPEWADTYAIRDDPKLNLPGKLGEARPRIDIEVEKTQRGVRPIFRLEAKRLGKNHYLSGYLGSEGLGAFLDAYYPLNIPEAGMLGYCQEHETSHWAHALLAELEKNPASYWLTQEEPPAARPVAAGLATLRSVHCSPKVGSLTVWHSLMRFW